MVSRLMEINGVSSYCWYAAWMSDEWKGRKVVITSDLGTGVERLIQQNDANMLTVTSAWPSPGGPGAGSQSSSAPPRSG